MDERDRAEFTEFATGRAGALIRLAYALTGDQHAAEDLLQTTLTRAAARWRRIHTAPEAYVRQIVYREQVSWWRRRARHRETAMADPPDRLAVPVTSPEARLDLQQALKALPAGKRGARRPQPQVRAQVMTQNSRNGVVRYQVVWVPAGSEAMSPAVSSNVGPSSISILAEPSKTRSVSLPGRVHLTGPVASVKRDNPDSAP